MTRFLLISTDKIPRVFQLKQGLPDYICITSESVKWHLYAVIRSL